MGWSLRCVEIGHSVRKVTNILHYQTKNPLPLFFIDLEPDGNNSDVFDITSVLHTKIKIEEPHKQRQIPRCTKCQSYDHTKSYCSHSPRCVKCGEYHLTISCTKSRESLPPARYAMSIIRQTTRDALPTKNFKNDADILSIQNKPPNNTNSNPNITILSQTTN